MKQQYGYGYAEALLYDAHPERFSISGIRWEGAIYAGGPVSAGEGDQIEYGSLGAAPYQSLATHVLPRRPLDPRYDTSLSRFLLGVAEWAVPRLRGLNRWRKGGPAPQLRAPKEASHIYADDVRQAGELSIATTTPGARLDFLEKLQDAGWRPLPGREPWDLELRPYRLLTTLEHHGGGYAVLKMRFLHPPGLRAELTTMLRDAAREAGLLVT